MIGLILALGLGLRWKTYFSLDGLNHDDALLSSNVIRHDEARLLKPLEFEPGRADRAPADAEGGGPGPGDR